MSNPQSSERAVEWAAPRPPLAAIEPIPDRLETIASSVNAASSVMSLVGGLVIWEIGARIWAIPFLPPFSRVLVTLVDLIRAGRIVEDLAHSLSNLALGYALAVICGVSVGMAMGRHRRLQAALDPVVVGMLASPKLLFIPLLYALFGVSRNAQIGVIFLSAVFIIVANTMSAVRTVDPAAVEMALAFGATRRQLFWKVLLPGSLPLTMAGLRLGMSRAVGGMITGEMFITLFGLGAELRTYGARFDAAGVLAILLVVAAVALLCTGALGTAERRLTHWAGPAA